MLTVEEVYNLKVGDTIRYCGCKKETITLHKSYSVTGIYVDGCPYISKDDGNVWYIYAIDKWERGSEGVQKRFLNFLEGTKTC